MTRGDPIHHRRTGHEVEGHIVREGATWLTGHGSATGSINEARQANLYEVGIGHSAVPAGQPVAQDEGNVQLMRNAKDQVLGRAEFGKWYRRCEAHEKRSCCERASGARRREFVTSIDSDELFV